jgi:hypothetical protein
MYEFAPFWIELFYTILVFNPYYLRIQIQTQIQQFQKVLDPDTEAPNATFASEYLLIFFVFCITLNNLKLLKANSNENGSLYGFGSAILQVVSIYSSDSLANSLYYSVLCKLIIIR